MMTGLGRQWAALTTLALFACSPAAGRSPTPPAPASTTDIGDAARGAEANGAELGGAPTTSPKLTEPRARRDCSSSNDCEIAWLLLDCCGSAAAHGVTRGTARGLERRMREAHPFFGRCECLAEATRLDDGATAAVASELTVTCEAHVCVTRRAATATTATTPPEPLEGTALHSAVQ